jgi:hypothetical protein
MSPAVKKILAEINALTPTTPVLDPLTVTGLKPVLALGRLLLLARFGRRLL